MLAFNKSQRCSATTTADYDPWWQRAVCGSWLAILGASWVAGSGPLRTNNFRPCHGVAKASVCMGGSKQCQRTPPPKKSLDYSTRASVWSIFLTFFSRISEIASWIVISGPKSAKKDMNDSRSHLQSANRMSAHFALFDSVQTRCIVKGEAQKSPLFWRFSGGFWFSQDRNSTRKPLNLIENPRFLHKRPL